MAPRLNSSKRGRAAAVLAQQAAADFAADNPDIDVAAAARKLKANPAFMDRTAPPEEPEVGDTISGGEDGTLPEGAANDPDDGFEATEEELAAQTGRRQAEDVV